jgi:hypothetical protein
MRSGAPVSCREITVAEFAELLELGRARPGKPTPDRRSTLKRALRIMQREGIARRHGPRGWHYTTEADLRKALGHVWQEILKRRMGVG